MAEYLLGNTFKMNIIEFLTAFGLGALVTTLVQAWLSHKAYISKRNFEEKKECYVGYLDALRKSEFEQNQESAINVGHWANRIELVGSKEVMFLCIRFKETNSVDDEVHQDRPKVLLDLKSAMRKDLGIESGI